MKTIIIKSIDGNLADFKQYLNKVGAIYEVMDYFTIRVTYDSDSTDKTVKNYGKNEIETEAILKGGLTMAFSVILFILVILIVSNFLPLDYGN